MLLLRVGLVGERFSIHRVEHLRIDDLESVSRSVRCVFAMRPSRRVGYVPGSQKGGRIVHHCSTHAEQAYHQLKP